MNILFDNKLQHSLYSNSTNLWISSAAFDKNNTNYAITVQVSMCILNNRLAICNHWIKITSQVYAVTVQVSTCVLNYRLAICNHWIKITSHVYGITVQVSTCVLYYRLAIYNHCIKITSQVYAVIVQISTCVCCTTDLPSATTESK